MQDTSGWNWDPGKRVVADTTAVAGEVQWLEEPYVSPDGEKAACIACTDEAEFGICINGELGEDRYEKAILPQFAPDGRLVVIVSQDMEWFPYVDGELPEEGYGFLWGTRFAGDTIAICAQQDMRYGMLLNGEPWPNFFENANNWSLSKDGARSCAAVQVKSTAAADIAAFQQGVFSVAVDGVAWDSVFMNCYTPVFNPAGTSVACQVRRTLYDYSIAVDGKGWDKNFPCVWEPAFNPATGAVVAPVRIAGKWGMAQDGDMLWEPKWTQLWQEQFSPDGEKLWAIAAVDFGKFTVAVNKAAWAPTFPVVHDLVLSPDGRRAAAICKDGTVYRVMVDGKVWDGKYDMLWPAVFSADGANVACVAEKGGEYTVVVNGKPYAESFEHAFTPAFSPDGSKVLVKGAKNGKVERIVADLGQF